MDKKKQTIQTYNKSARRLAAKFDSQDARVHDLEEVFRLVSKDNPKVLEIGCGNGRDAKEILKYTNDYLGIDVSEEMIGLAQSNNPQGKFKVADAERYEYPKRLDIVFAFASLIHSDERHVERILCNLFMVMNSGGIVRLSLKYGNEYREITKEDEFGIRTYYLFSDENIVAISCGFDVLKKEIVELRGQKWLEVIMRKV